MGSPKRKPPADTAPERTARGRSPAKVISLYGAQLLRTHGHLTGKGALPALSGLQYAFVTNLMRGAGPMEAYRASHPAMRECSNQKIAEHASRLLANGKILAWVDYLSRNEITAQVRTVGEHVSRLDRLQIAAVDMGDINTAVRAEMAIGKVSGLYIDRSITETNVSFNAQSLELALASRNPAFAERLRQAHAMADSMDGTAKLLEMAPDVVSEPVPVSRNRDHQR